MSNRTPGLGRPYLGARAVTRTPARLPCHRRIVGASGADPEDGQPQCTTDLPLRHGDYRTFSGHLRSSTPPLALIPFPPHPSAAVSGALPRRVAASSVVQAELDPAIDDGAEVASHPPDRLTLYQLPSPTLSREYVRALLEAAPGASGRAGGHLNSEQRGS